MTIRIINRKHVIYFYDFDRLDKEERLYHIDKNRLLNQVLEFNGAKCSGWIIQLLGMRWFDDPIVAYEIARIIQDKCPDNEIDWESTLFMVERSMALNQILEERLERGMVSDKLTGPFLDLMANANEKSTPEENEKTLKGVRHRLKLYGLL